MTHDWLAAHEPLRCHWNHKPLHPAHACITQAMWLSRRRACKTHERVWLQTEAEGFAEDSKRLEAGGDQLQTKLQALRAARQLVVDAVVQLQVTSTTFLKEVRTECASTVQTQLYLHHATYAKWLQT